MSELKYTTKINDLLDSLDATKFPETVDYLAHNNMIVKDFFLSTY